MPTLRGLWRGITRIAPLIGAGAAVAAVVVAYYGLVGTATQLKGTTIYSVARDGKALQRRYEKGEATPDEVMSYFFWVYTLRVAGVLDEPTWGPIELAICNFSKSGANVRNSPETKIKQNMTRTFEIL